MCDCELETVLRQVKKDGLNKGKLFYCCSQYYEDKCDYFMWKDESDKKLNVTNESKLATSESKLATNESKSTANESKSTTSESKSEEKIDYKKQQKMGLMCYCNLPTVSREVKKDGPNKGKKFYTCSRYYDDKCKYFMWEFDIKK